MRLVVNTRVLLSPVTGVQAYTREILSRLSDAGTASPRSWMNGGFKGHLWEQLVLPAKISAQEALFSPSNTGPLAVSRQIVTIHDAATLDHPEWFKPFFAGFYQFLLPKLARRVRKILTVSNFSKERLIHRLNVPEDHIAVIPNGVTVPAVSPDVSVTSLNGAGGRPFYLYVGSLEPRKNLSRLFEAWRKAELRDFELLIVGSIGNAFQQEELRIPANCRLLGRVSDKQLDLLYRQCRAFVYPSIYEGFGLPPLEALARGAIVLTSRIPPHVETCGDSVDYFDPFGVDEMTATLRTAAGLSDDQVEVRRRRGVERAALFSWDKAASQTAKVFNQSFA